jgi:hypothetical protein
MEQGSFEQALLALIRRVPEEKRMAVLHTMQLLVGRHLELDGEDGHKPYNLERHRKTGKCASSLRLFVVAWLQPLLRSAMNVAEGETIYFLDTSALAKLYHQEQGSEMVER